MKTRKYVLIAFAVMLAVTELLYQLGITSFGLYRSAGALFRFFNVISGINF